MDILVGDDHSVVRKGLIMIIKGAYPLAHIEEASDGADLIKKLDDKPWSVIISDISMPGRSGLEVVKHVKEHYKHIPILILSVHSPEHYAVRALKAGAWGYITKESAPEELVSAIELALAGKKYVPPTVAELLIDYKTDEEFQHPHRLLSDREFAVFELLAAGKKVSDIADDLSLSINTISTYRARILEKMHITSNADMTKYAIEHNFKFD